MLEKRKMIMTITQVLEKMHAYIGMVVTLCKKHFEKCGCLNCQDSFVKLTL